MIRWRGAPVPGPVPLVVSLWIDHAKVGRGRRGFVVLGLKRKWVTLFYALTLTQIRVTRGEYRAGAPRPVLFAPRALARAIQAAQEKFRRQGRPDGGRAAARALDLLRDVAGESEAA